MIKIATKVENRSSNKLEPAFVAANSMLQKELINKAWNFYSNNFVPSDLVSEYCLQKGLDATLLGHGNGQFHKTVTRRHRSFDELIKIGLLTKDGKDKYTDCLVLPVMDGMDITGLKFLDLSKLEKEKAKETLRVLPINDNSFRVEINHRIYVIQNLVRRGHQLKATVKFSCGINSYVDVINFYSAANRKKLTEGLVEETLIPYDEIKSDLNKLLELCEKQPLKPKLSDRAEEVLNVVEGEFTRTTIQELLMWDRMKAKRAVEELLKANVITQKKGGKPFKYEVTACNTK